MFKQTRKKIPAWEPITRFMIFVAKKNGFVDFLSGDESPRCSRTADDINLSVQKAMIIPKRPPKTIRLTIQLNVHKSLPVYLVTLFIVEGGIEHITGQAVLAHYGKRLAYNRGKGHNDFESDDVSECWTVSCAKDLEALMRAYDMLASINQCPTVFNLP